MTTARSHRSFNPDPTRRIVALLWPLLAINTVLWIWYAKTPAVAAVWFVMLVGSIVFMRRTS